MIYKIRDEDKITLSSGKELYANRNLVSCVKTEKGWELAEGYDGEIFLDGDLDVDCSPIPSFTKQELINLAEQMIARWSAFRFDVIDDKVSTKD